MVSMKPLLFLGYPILCLIPARKNRRADRIEWGMAIALSNLSPFKRFTVSKKWTIPLPSMGIKRLKSPRPLYMLIALGLPIAHSSPFRHALRDLRKGVAITISPIQLGR